MRNVHWMPIVYGVAMLVVYLLYEKDKHAAKNGMWRVPESTLHLFELLGGWVSAYWAQIRLRHKTRKLSYQITFWLIVTLHIIFWVSMIFPEIEWLRFISSKVNEFLPTDLQIGQDANQKAISEGYIRWEKSN